MRGDIEPAEQKSDQEGNTAEITERKETEMKELLQEKGFWAAALLSFLGMAGGFHYYEIEYPLSQGSFLKFYQTALDSQVMLFLIPIAASLSSGAAYVRESSCGFIKFYISRISRMEYIKRKTLQIYAGGFLPLFLSGISGLLLCFLFLYPLELQGGISWETVWENILLLLRISVIGGITAELAGIFGAIFRNYYMAYGLPFVSYYMLIILKDRYLPNMYAMYPKEWVTCQQNWGADGMGIWIFFLAFSLAALLFHGLILYYRLKEIN